MGDLILEVGSSYSTTTGRIFFIDRVITEAEPLFHEGFRFVAKSGNLFLSYTASGKCYLTNASYLDLIKLEKVIKLKIGKTYITRSGEIVKIIKPAPKWVGIKYKKFINAGTKFVQSNYFRNTNDNKLKIAAFYNVDTGRFLHETADNNPLDIIAEVYENVVIPSKPIPVDYTESNSNLADAQINPIQFVSPTTEQLCIDITYKQKPFVLVVKQNDKIISTITVNPDGNVVTA